MKVCLRSRAEAERNDIRDWLRLDEEYVVLCIEANLWKSVYYRIASLEGTPALFEASLFTITDPRVDEEWIVRQDDSGRLVFEPEPWSVPGFWEDYFNQDPTAVARYRDVLQRMTADGVNALGSRA
jgi:hypothetical protein